VISFLNFRKFAGLAFLLGLIVISSKSHAQEFSTESKRAIKFYEEGNKKFN